MAKFDPAKFKKKIKGEDVPVDDSEDAKTRAQQKLAKLKAGGTGNEKSKDFRKSKETPKVPRETFEEKDPDKEDYRERADRERLEALEALIKDFEGMLEHYANNTLMERGILDENMEIDGEEGLFNAACFLFEMNEIETTPPALPQAVKIKFAQWRRAVQISPDDARENHEAGADIDDSTGDEITDLQKAADTPNNGLTPTMYEYVTSNWKFTHLADFARCTEEQLLEIKGIGSKSVRDLRKFLEERGIVIGSQAKFVDPDEEDDDEYVDDFEDEEDDGPVAAAPVAATPVEGGAVRPRSTYAADAGGFTISYKRKVNNPEDKYEYIELGIEGPGGPSASVALVNLRALRDEVNKMALDPDLFE